MHNSFDVYWYAFYIIKYLEDFSSLALTFLLLNSGYSIPRWYSLVKNHGAAPNQRNLSKYIRAWKRKRNLLGEMYFLVTENASAGMC